MNCPVCKKSAMVTLELDQVEIDYCFDCNGIWLDEGELEMLLDDREKALELLGSFEEAAIDEDKVKCPICMKKMEKIKVGDSQRQVIIDMCSKKHGIWFDKGELDEVLEHGKLDQDNKVRRLLNDIFRQNDKEI